MPLYQVSWTEDAATIRDSLPPKRKDKLLQAVELLADNPYVTISQQIGTEETERAIQLTDKIVGEYAILRGQIMIAMLRLFDSGSLVIED